MRRLSIILSLLLVASTAAATQASASSSAQMSFVMMNPLTKVNVGAGIQVSIYPINHPQQRTDLRTDANGVVTFTPSQERYGLDWYCGPCNAPARTNGATAYLLEPKSDGTFEVLSMADEPVVQNSDGVWILTTEIRIPANSNSPWKLMSPQPDLGGGARLMFLLTNGKVMVQTSSGGVESRQKWWLLTPDINGNYDTGTWEQAPSPKDYNPTTYNGAVLHDGNLMVFGGEQNATDAGVVTNGTNICEIYNVATNSWTQIAPPNNGQGDWKALMGPNAALADGRILIGASPEGSNANESMLYDPITNSWALTGANKVGENNEAGFTLLQNNKVLTTQQPAGTLGTGTSIAEIYDPATGLWSLAGETNALFNFVEVGPALGLRNGTVLQTGSLGANGLYNPTTNTWSVVPPFAKLKNGLQLVAQDNEAAILPSGNILTITATYIHSTNFGNGIAPGRSMAPARYEEYDWRTNSWIDLPEGLLSIPSWGGPNMTFFLPLPNGQIMIAERGGIQFFTDTGSPEASWAPVVSSVSSLDLAPKTQYTISGKQLSGLTQGLHWGDEWQAATNYPLVRIVNNASHHVFYATTSNISSTSITPMVPSTFAMTIGDEVENGPSQLYVVATGIASLPIDVTISGGSNKFAEQKAAADKAASDKAAADKAAADKAASDKAAADKAAADLLAQKKVVASKKIILTCIKGKLTKKVIAVNPVCPKGYKKK